MKLACRDLDTFAVGLDRSEIVAEAWRAHRLPAAMRDRYLRQDTDDRFQKRICCPSCVRLRLTSDTQSLRVGLRYGSGPPYHPSYRGGLLVDERVELAFGPQSSSAAWEGAVFQQPKAQKHLFDLWLPHLCQADVLFLELDEGSTVTAAPGLPVRWLAYGDSITQGMTASLPTRTVLALCARALNAEVHSVAVGSAALDPWLAETVPPGDYDIVSIAYGANDFATNIPVQHFQQNARRLVAALAEQLPGRPVVVITPLTWAGLQEPNAAGFRYEEYRRALPPLAGEFQQVRIVPGDRLLTDAPEWRDGGIHPNDRGFALYAENLLPYLRAALAR